MAGLKWDRNTRFVHEDRERSRKSLLGDQGPSTAAQKKYIKALREKKGVYQPIPVTTGEARLVISKLKALPDLKVSNSQREWRKGFDTSRRRIASM